MLHQSVGRGAYKFLVDEPKRTEDEDSFAHADHVHVLLEILQSSGTPFNIGLLGGWGTGKTTILNFLRQRLESDKGLNSSFDLMTIDAWSLSKDSLRHQVLLELNQHFKSRAYSREQIEDRLYNIQEREVTEPESREQVPFEKRLSRAFWASWVYIFSTLLIIDFLLIIGPVLNWIDLKEVEFLLTAFGVPLILALINSLQSLTREVRRSSKRIVPRIEHPQQFEQMFRRIIKGRGRRTLIVAIDNLDRSESEVAVDMLRTIKNFMNVEGCVFLVACDDGALVKHLTSVWGKSYDESDAREFLRKFFQASLSIPPFLDEPLREYVRDLIEETGVPFHQNVVDVMIFAARKNPRRLKQFINNMVALFILAERREEAGIILKGAITDNTPFLAKLTIIESDWPAFYRELQQRETLLHEAEEWITSSSDATDGGLVQSLRQQPELRHFLESTVTVDAPDIRPFLSMSQESYDSTLLEAEAFVLRLNEGDVDYIRGYLERLSAEETVEGEEFDTHFHLILREVRANARLQRYVPLFNNLRVLLGIIDLSPESLRDEITQEFERRARVKDIRENLRRLDITRMFAVIDEMEPNFRDEMLTSYSETLLQDEGMDIEALDLLLTRVEVLPPRAKRNVNVAWKSVLARDQDAALTILEERFFGTPERVTLLNQESLRDLAETLGGDEPEVNGRRVDAYLSVSEAADPATNATFLSSLLGIMTQSEETTLQEQMQLALRGIVGLVPERVDESVLPVFYESCTRMASQMADHGHKLEFYTPLLKFFSVLDEQQRNALLVPHLRDLMAAGNADVVHNLLESARAHNVPLLTSEEVLQAFASRIPTNLQEDRFVDALLADTPSDKQSIISPNIVNMINSDDDGLRELILGGLQRKHESLTEESLGTAVEAALDALETRPIGQQGPLFEAIEAAFERSSPEHRTRLLDQVEAHVTSNDPAARELGIRFFEGLLERADKARTRMTLRQVVVKLQGVGTLTEAVSDLLALVLAHQEHLEPGDMGNLADLLAGQLNTARPEESQRIGLSAITGLGSLGDRESDVLSRILELARTTQIEEIRVLAGQTLEQLKGLKGPKGFWKEAADYMVEAPDETNE